MVSNELVTDLLFVVIYLSFSSSYIFSKFLSILLDHFALFPSTIYYKIGCSLWLLLCLSFLIFTYIGGWSHSKSQWHLALGLFFIAWPMPLLYFTDTIWSSLHRLFSFIFSQTHYLFDGFPVSLVASLFSLSPLSLCPSQISSMKCAVWASTSVRLCSCLCV